MSVIDDKEIGNEKKDGKKKDKKKIILVCVLLVVIVALIGVIVYLVMPKGNEDDVRPMMVTEDNADDIVDELDKDGLDKMYNCRMSTTWTFENGEAESENAYVANTDYNHYAVYFEVQIDSTKEIVYKSATVPVGSEVKGITLDKSLEAGEYPATVIYHLLDDDGEEVSSVGFTVTIQVLH